MNIEVTRDNVTILEQSERPHENEYKITTCYFTFDEFTDSFQVKRAIFTILSTGEMYEVDIINNECDIPIEVLKHAYETVKLGVYGYNIGENDELLNRFSPSYAEFVVPTGSYEEGAQSPEEITPSQYDLYSQALQEGLQEVDDKLDEVVETVDGKLEEVDDKLEEVDTTVNNKIAEVDNKLDEVDDKIDEVDDKLIEVNTAITETNNLNLDVSNKVDGDVTVTLTKKDASTKTVVISDGTSLQFMWQGTSLGIKTDDMEEYVFVDLQGSQGKKGDTGEPFTIKKTYSSVAEMNADFNNMEYGDYVMIASSVEVEDNAKLYTRGETQWIFITDFSGSMGIRGPVGATPNIQIGSVTSGSTPSVTRTGTDENPILNFVLQPGPQGEVGPTGLTGNGISSIEKTSTSGLVDTYTITFTNGNTTTFDVSNGKGIDRIEKTATVGNIDTYTIYFNDNSTSTYEVANGEVTREELEEEVDRLSMIYNAFPTTSDEGEEMTLNGTAEVPFKKLNLKGNTSQTTYSGKNLSKLSDKSSTTTNNLTYSVSNQVGIYSGTTNDSTTTTLSFDTFTLGAGTYSFCLFRDTTSRMDISLRKAGTNEVVNATNFGNVFQNKITVRTFTLTEEISFQNMTIWIPSETATNDHLKFMIVSGSYTTSNIGKYEPYTGGIPAPNPSYPYPVNVVTGNNSIKVEGKNLFDKDNATLYNGYISSTSPYDLKNSVNSKTLYLKIEPNTTYTISKTASTYFRTGYTNEFPTTGVIVNGLDITTPSSKTITTGTNAEYLVCTFVTNNDTLTVQEILDTIMIEKGSSATTYEPYTGASYPINLPEGMELCKIGDYQDDFRKSTGKNLLNISDITSGNGITNNGDGTITLNGTITNTSFTLTNPFTLKANKTYILSLTNTYSNGSNSTFILRNGSTNIMTIYFKNKSSNAPFTPTQDTVIDTLRIFGDDVNFSNYTFSIQLEENNQYTSYEPYGKVWYLNKQIGKVVLDGSETIERISTQLSNYYRFAVSSPTDLKKNSIIDVRAGLLMSDKFIEVSNKESNEQQVNGILVRANNSYNFVITYDETSSYTASEFKTWLSTHNTIVYYALATPTITEITDSTLISQLNALEKAYSYDTQTNISQTNADKPFILDVEAILSLRNIFNS